MRNAIADISATAVSLDDFMLQMQEKYHISVTDKRGRLSYLHPDRAKNISERALGTDYTGEAVQQRILENTQHKETHPLSFSARDPNPLLPDTGSSVIPDPALAYEDALRPYTIFFVKSELRLVVDLQNCVKAQQSQSYKRKVKISNLKQMADTVAYVQEHGYDDREHLQAEYDSASEKLADARRSLKDTEQKMKDLNEQLHHTGQYLSNKKIYAQMLPTKNKKAFRQEHSEEIAKYEESRKFLKELHPDGKIPSLKSLYADREKLQIQKSAKSDTYHYF
ncbi:MAG: hypothetical protein Q4B57_05955 [Eubacteriales bacterium]|nr:hypothetical protein [Eubacteriales bacterium]